MWAKRKLRCNLVGKTKKPKVPKKGTLTHKWDNSRSSILCVYTWMLVQFFRFIISPQAVNSITIQIFEFPTRNWFNLSLYHSLSISRALLTLILYIHFYLTINSNSTYFVHFSMHRHAIKLKCTWLESIDYYQNSSMDWCSLSFVRHSH